MMDKITDLEARLQIEKEWLGILSDPTPNQQDQEIGKKFFRVLEQKLGHEPNAEFLKKTGFDPSELKTLGGLALTELPELIHKDKEQKRGILDQGAWPLRNRIKRLKSLCMTGEKETRDPLLVGFGLEMITLMRKLVFALCEPDQRKRTAVLKTDAAPYEGAEKEKIIPQFADLIVKDPGEVKNRAAGSLLLMRKEEEKTGGTTWRKYLTALKVMLDTPIFQDIQARVERPSP